MPFGSPTPASRSLRALPLALLLAAAACGGGGGANPAPEPAQSASGQTTAAPGTRWPIKTREHVDLWLHGFALISEDTTKVPYFRRGYRDQLTVTKNGANVTTQLDANREKLRARLDANRSLVNAQFLALYFGSWQELRQVADLFVRAEGDPRRANSRELAAAIATLAGYFPAAPDREWLRLFVASLDDESQKFYHDYWLQQQRNRAATLSAVDTLWQGRYRPKLQGFLNGTQQPSGDLVLSLPLDGEGRTISGGNSPGVSESANIITVAFPERPEDAVEAIYVFAHEAVGALAASAVNDNTTPSEKRSGVADRLQSAAAVRTGYLLLERVAPELADGYARYYLRSAGAAADGGSLPAALAAAFPLPDGLRDAISRQLDVVLGGI
jgi:hypothetical protein